MEFFKTITTKEHATLLMKELAKQLHPLKGGSPEIWAEINKQYQAFEPAAQPAAQPAPEPAPEPAQQQVKQPAKQPARTPPQQVVEAAKFAAALEGCQVEILGSWAWVTGATLKHWQTLKSYGFYYSAKKVACYFHMPEDKVKRRTGKQLSLEEIEKRHQKQLF